MARKIFCQRVLNQLQLPVFVKPANTGSSVGIDKVKSAEELMTAINMHLNTIPRLWLKKG